MSKKDYLAGAATANPVYFRTYSRRNADGREAWEYAVSRSILDPVSGLAAIGQLTEEESRLVNEECRAIRSLPAGRALWVAGTQWAAKPENFSGLFNCTSWRLCPSKYDDSPWETYWHLISLGMMGCGVGLVAEKQYVEQFPPIINTLSIETDARFGLVPKGDRRETTTWKTEGDTITVIVGDSRQGWADAYVSIFEIASDASLPRSLTIKIDLTHVRPAGEPLVGFGGTANPIKLATLFERMAVILNHAAARSDRQRLYPLEAVLLAGLGADAVVSGNIRRFAGMVQWSHNDSEIVEWLGTSAIESKLNLWKVGEDGNWAVDPIRDPLRTANHTRVFHRKPTKAECIDAVRKQFQSGEGAIQWAGEAVARSSRDLLNTPERKAEFLAFYASSEEGRANAAIYLDKLHFADHGAHLTSDDLQHRLRRYGLNPCAEVLGDDFHCNLSTNCTNLFDPLDLESHRRTFTASSLAAAALLNRPFAHPRYQASREQDPIILVSVTGLFDFFVTALGVDWLKWWEKGRSPVWDGATLEGLRSLGQCERLFQEQLPEFWAEDEAQFGGAGTDGDRYRRIERLYLSHWRGIVEEVVWDYCDRHQLKRPNRCTGVKPEGTLSLLTGASPGWHPPKSVRYIRRITFRRDDPVALACIDYGYSVVPSQSCTDEDGRLLDDPFDPRVTEWLVEIPVSVPWADLPGADAIEIEQFSALAQFDFWLQVQQHYTTFNTSATIELREDEIEALGSRIYQAIANDEGYMSAALLARFDAPFPRLPFEKIDRATYDRLSAEVLARRTTDDFHAALARYDQGETAEAGPAGCDSDKCLMPEVPKG